MRRSGALTNAFIQLKPYGGTSVSVGRLQPLGCVSNRYFADSATTKPVLENPAKVLLQGLFLKFLGKYKSFIQELDKVKITLDPEDPKAVSDYATTMAKIRAKVGAPSYPEKIAGALKEARASAPDVRTYFQNLKSLRAGMGIPDIHGADEIMLEAVTRVEKKIGKPLLFGDPKGIPLLKAEFDTINTKLGINQNSLPKLESEMEMGLAKSQLVEIKQEVEKTIEDYRKRYEVEEEVEVDIKNLDHRTYL